MPRVLAFLLIHHPDPHPWAPDLAVATCLPATHLNSCPQAANSTTPNAAYTPDSAACLSAAGRGRTQLSLCLGFWCHNSLSFYTRSIFLPQCNHEPPARVPATVSPCVEKPLPTLVQGPIAEPGMATFLLPYCHLSRGTQFHLQLS